MSANLLTPPPPLSADVFYEQPLAIFLKYFVRKNWRDGGESLLKNGAIDGYAY